MQTPSDDTERRTLWRQVARTLAGEIAEGALAAGDRLPAEAALMRRFGVSRHTVRRAMAELAERGIVRVEQGRGAFVHDTAIHYRLSRKVTHTENLLREGRRPEALVLGIDELPAMHEVAAGLGLREGTPVTAIRSLGRADGVPIAVSANFVERARWPGLDLPPGTLLRMSAVYAAMGSPNFARLGTVIRSRPPTREEARLLEQPLSRWVLVTRKVDGDPDGRPLCYGETVWSADRIQLVVDPDG